MKTKNLLLTCIVSLFCINLSYAKWFTVDPKAEKYYSTSPYAYCLNNPARFIDPDGKQVFGDKSYSNFDFNWSGGNYASMRRNAAKQLISYIQTERLKNNLSKDEPITLVGHSHGGNVNIEAINMMVDMEEFQGVTINLLTINTPVRNDYQLSEKAQSLVSHVNIYDETDPVQTKGGASMIVLPDNKSNAKGTGEFGSAGRTFNNAKNIKVDNPQGIFKDFHNSHNRVQDWLNKLPKK